MRAVRARLSFLGAFAALAGAACVGPPDLPDGAVSSADLRAAGVFERCSAGDLSIADRAVPLVDLPGSVVVVAGGCMVCVADILDVPAGLLDAGGVATSDSPPGTTGLGSGGPNGMQEHVLKTDPGPGNGSGNGEGNGGWTDLDTVSDHVKDPTPQPVTPPGSSSGVVNAPPRPYSSSDPD